MGTLNAFYVRASGPGRVAAICTAYPNAYTEPGTEFYAINQPADRFLRPHDELNDELKRFSAELKTDVIWLSFQSVVDAFQYHHWNNGILLRSLVFGCFQREREWELVEGATQPWESSVLFADLAGVLKYYDDEEERRKIEKIYQEKIIETGASVPNLDGRETARDVAEYYRLPGWCLTPETVG